MLVLRAGPPHFPGLPGITCVTFFPSFFRIDFRAPKIPKRSPRGTKMSPNGSPNDPKAMPEAPKIQPFRTSENSQKPLFLLWFRHIGRSWCGRFHRQNGDRRADRPPDTPKRRKWRPDGAQGRPSVPEWSPGGRYNYPLFQPIFVLGPPGRPGGSPRSDFPIFASMLVDFGSILSRFGTDF